MTRARPLLLVVLLLLIGCGGGGPAPTASPALTSSPAAVPTQAPSVAPPASATPAGAVSAEALCGLLTAADWQQFNYVTSAQPEVTSDAPGTAICQYASGLFLEVYVDDNETDAADTFQTILDNVPIDDPQSLTIPGADETQFDADIGDDHAGLAMRAGRMSVLITGLARDSAQAELIALAGLVLARSGAIR